MQEFINKISKSGLTPNEYCGLFCLKNDLKVAFAIPVDSLTEKGYVQNGQLTHKAEEIFSSLELENKALTANTMRFMQIFPPIILPHGAPSRGHLRVVRDRLRAFIEFYSYDWDIIFQATEAYVRRFKERGYKYMKGCANFIMTAEGDSLLALECDIIKHAKKIEAFSGTI